MTVVDLSFPLSGASVPRDHGYALYAAITTRLPLLHGARWLGVHPINGRAVDDVVLLGRTSHVRLRLPADRIGEVLGLAGARLNVGGSHVQVGPPVVHALEPRPSLDARLVLLKLTEPPTRANAALGRDVLDNDAFAERYRAELGRQLAALDVKAELELRGRRSMRIKGRRLIGYSVRLRGLDPDASLRIQERGLGGRRALGCGLFRPTRGM